MEGYLGKSELSDKELLDDVPDGVLLEQIVVNANKKVLLGVQELIRRYKNKKKECDELGANSTMNTNPEKYFVASNIETPLEIFFERKCAFESHYRYLDAFDEHGQHVATYGPTDVDANDMRRFVIEKF